MAAVSLSGSGQDPLSAGVTAQASAAGSQEALGRPWLLALAWAQLSPVGPESFLAPFQSPLLVVSTQRDGGCIRELAPSRLPAAAGRSLGSVHGLIPECPILSWQSPSPSTANLHPVLWAPVSTPGKWAHWPCSSPSPWSPGPFRRSWGSVELSQHFCWSPRTFTCPPPPRTKMPWVQWWFEECLGAPPSPFVLRQQGGRHTPIWGRAEHGVGCCSGDLAQPAPGWQRDFTVHAPGHPRAPPGTRSSWRTSCVE